MLLATTVRKATGYVLRATPELLEQNAILHGVEEPVAAIILAQGELVDLSLRQQIYEPEQPLSLIHI